MDRHRGSAPSPGSRNPSYREHQRAATGRTPDRWETSRSSGASSSVSGASAGSRPSRAQPALWKPIKILLRAVASLFSGEKETKSSSSKTIKSPNPMHNAHGAVHDSRRGSRKGELYGKSLMAPGTSKFTLEEILRATKNFSPTLKIGQGGFGTVYKGLLDDGTVVAVKRAKKNMYEGHLNVEFQSEIKMLARIEHLNLVRYFGYLEENGERIIIVEYVPNGTLRQHLDGLHGKHLDLSARLDIATDVAHAITYLHMYTDHPIIHRDIKSSNVLLTDNLRAKVADFGFARLGANESGVTHVSTQVKGTAGYLDPEYLRTYQLTEKSDVYSFGVLLVELVSSRRPIEPNKKLGERLTPKWAVQKFIEGQTIQIMDPNLPFNPATSLALEKILELSLQCLGPTRHDRPSMRTCAKILWDIRKEYRHELSLDPMPSHSRTSSTAEMV